MRKFLAMAVLILLAFGFAQIADAVTLTWKAPTTNADGTPLTDLAGYKIYRGSKTGLYDQPVLDVKIPATCTGTPTTCTYSYVVPDGTWFWVLTAYDTAKNESKYSNEVFLLVDTTPPVITAFAIPATSASLSVAISTFTATDANGVTGYLVNESATAPAASIAGWSTAIPTSYTFTTDGSHTLYAWSKDAKGNVSASKSATVTITLPDLMAPAPATNFTITD